MKFAVMSFGGSSGEVYCEPSVLNVVSRDHDVKWLDQSGTLSYQFADMYLCSVYTAGYFKFIEWKNTFAIPKDRIAVGGYHPSSAPEDFVGYADYIVKGACDDIVATLSKGKGIINGIFTGTNVPNRSCYSVSRNIQALPDYYEEELLTSVATSFGCPFRCDFCATPTISPKLASRTLDSIEAETHDMPQSSVMFIRDENFLKNKDWKERLDILKRKTDKLYLFSSSDMLTKETVRELKNRKVWMVSLGLEDVTKEYTKNRNLDSAVRNLKNAGVYTDISFIINPAFRQGFVDGILDKLMERLKCYMPERICGNFLIPYPGTKVWNEYKFMLKYEDYPYMTGKYALLEPDYLIRNDLEEKLIQFQLDYFMSKEYNQVRNFECNDTLHNIFKSLQSKINY